jgi:hypothetical protein
VCYYILVFIYDNPNDLDDAVEKENNIKDVLKISDEIN